MRTVQIPIKDLNVLRKTFKEAQDIINRLGSQLGSEETPVVVPPKESKAQKINKYKSLIGSGARGTKPNHLKK